MASDYGPEPLLKQGLVLLSHERLLVLLARLLLDAAARLLLLLVLLGDVLLVLLLLGVLVGEVLEVLPAARGGGCCVVDSGHAALVHVGRVVSRCPTRRWQMSAQTEFKRERDKKKTFNFKKIHHGRQT
jgi:hypothetical protein